MMKIIIEGDAKEIAGLLETKRLDSKIAGVKKENVAEKITIPIDLDIAPIEDAQGKADKLKATLIEVQELIRKKNLSTCY